MENKQSEIGLKLTNILAGMIQVFEAISVITIVSLALNKGIDALVSTYGNDAAAHVAILIKVVLISLVVMGGFLVADLMKWLEYSALKFFVEKSYWKVGIYTIALGLVGYSFYLAERNASRQIGHGYFSVQEDKKAYTDDANYNLRLSGKQKIDAEWTARKKELDSQKTKCATCKDIEASYNSQINLWRSKRIITDADRVYVQNNISALEAKKSNESSVAKQKHEAEIDKKYFDEEAIYKNAISEASNTIRRIESTIDTGKVLNEADIRARKQDIDFWTSGFSWITVLAQILLRIGRFHFLLENNRIGELFDENNFMLDLMQQLPFVGKYFEDTFWAEKLGNFKKVRGANRVEYNRTQSWNTELNLKRKAKYWGYIKENGLKDNLWAKIKFMWSNEDTVPDEDFMNESSDAYNNGYSKKKQIINTAQQNIVNINNAIPQQNSANIANNAVNLNGQSDDFNKTMQEVIDLLLGLKPFYSDVEFAELQEVINILENLKI